MQMLSLTTWIGDSGDGGGGPASERQVTLSQAAAW